MPRKNNDNNPLQIKLRVNTLPRSVKPATFYTRLIENIMKGRELPPLWEVEVSWRNPGTKHGATRKWQTGDFETVVSDSGDMHAGFNVILHDALVRKLRKVQR